MKRIMMPILLFLIGMTVFAQSPDTLDGPDMSFYLTEFNRPNASSLYRLGILETVRDADITGIGEFYHDALITLISRIPDAKTREDRNSDEAAARILVQGLAAELHTVAAPEVWQIVQFADSVMAENYGVLMHDALIALGQLGDMNYVSHITLRLDNFNTDLSSDVETRRRMQRGAVGCIHALEALADPAGYRHVFLASLGWYDMATRNIARAALPNILEDPVDIIIEIIQAPNIVPAVKYEALQVMLASNAPDPSKARVAAVALHTGWTYITSDPNNQRILREMRVRAISTIQELGVYDEDEAVVVAENEDEDGTVAVTAGNSVYFNLRRSYRNNIENTSPDFEEIRMTISALSALGTDEAVDMLFGFLRELHIRRQLGPWDTTRERQIYGWLLVGLASSGTESTEVRNLLSTIQRSNYYTGAEQNWARNALARLTN